MKIFASHSLEETGKIAGGWLSAIAEKRTNVGEATVVGLSGHLGAGKTAFVKQVAKRLGIEEEITSPTFVIMKIYQIQDSRSKILDPRIPWKRLVHIDAYRLEKREELEALDWEALVSDQNNLILMEWPENVGLNREDFSSELFFEIKEGAHYISIR